jgi:hypothetical protein
MLHVNHRGGARWNIFLSKHCSIISKESRKCCAVLSQTVGRQALFGL